MLTGTKRRSPSAVPR